jgi:hypothetical protein
MRKGRIESLMAARAGYSEKRLAAPAAAIAIAILLKRRRFSWSIVSIGVVVARSWGLGISEYSRGIIIS